MLLIHSNPPSASIKCSYSGAKAQTIPSSTDIFSTLSGFSLSASNATVSPPVRRSLQNPFSLRILSVNGQRAYHSCGTAHHAVIRKIFQVLQRVAHIISQTAFLIRFKLKLRRELSVHLLIRRNHAFTTRIPFIVTTGCWLMLTGTTPVSIALSATPSMSGFSERTPRISI